MRKHYSTPQCTLVRFSLLLLLSHCFFYAHSSVPPNNVVLETEVKTQGKLVQKELAMTSIEDHDKEAKFKAFFLPKPIFKKPLFKKSFPVINPFPLPKPFPILKKPFPVPILEKPIPKPLPIPVFPKPIPKSIPIKPIPNPIPIVKKPIPIPIFKKP